MIERSPGNYDWSLHDAVVTAAVARGLKVVGTIAYTPGWARPAGTDDKHPPSDLSAYARFAGEVAKHYAPLGVHHWEIWNEPNIWVFWKPQADAARYAQMLKLTYPAIKSADSSAVVITGGTAPAGGFYNSGDPRDINTLRFLEAIYANGGGDSFDAVAHHPYSFPFLPSNGHPDIAWSQVANTSPSLRSIMVAHGDGDKQIWGTEFGGTTNGPAGSFVAETTQAEIVAEGYKAWLQYGAWAGPLFVYCYRDPDSTTDTRENFFGLVRFDFSPKPALIAYESAVRTLTASNSASP
jgi:polysaccharide biosynthesis protein PslG